MTKKEVGSDLKLLGLKVKDRVTGFAGVVESISYDLYGCIQAVVRPEVARNDKGEQFTPEGRWLDVSRLEVLDQKPVMEVPGDRFDVDRVVDEDVRASRRAAGPAEKPVR